MGDSVSATKPDTITAPGELGEELAGGAGHEADRGIDSRKRQCHGQHGEANFLAADQRRLDRLLAVFDVTVDVLQHDDGVVDDQPDGEHEREQGQRVDGEAEHIHDGEGADQRHGNSDERNKRGTERA